MLKTGKYKDIGSSARKITPEEKQLLQSMLNDTFLQFIDAVSEGRKMPVSEVRKLADGRVFTGRQAKKLKLIDEVGGLQEAKAGAAREAGIKGEPKVVEYDKGFWESFGGSDSESESLRFERKDEAIVRRLLQMAPDLAR